MALTVSMDGYEPSIRAYLDGQPGSVWVDAYAYALRDELDATRARVAELERERDEAADVLNARAAKMLDGMREALAAREAECAELRAALGTVMEMVRLWHGMGMDTVSEQRAWKLYEEGAPEWQPLRDLRDRPSGDHAALRAMMERAVIAGLRAAHEHDERGWTVEQNAAAIVARLLPAPQAQGENERGNG